MGATVSLPEPYSCFPLLSVGDVDRIVHKHRDECDGDFMISTAALSKLLGGSGEAEMRATRLQTEKGIGRFGEVNALAFLAEAESHSQPRWVVACQRFAVYVPDGNFFLANV